MHVNKNKEHCHYGDLPRTSNLPSFYCPLPLDAPDSFIPYALPQATSLFYVCPLPPNQPVHFLGAEGVKATARQLSPYYRVPC